jgi:hypothetical protein
MTATANTVSECTARPILAAPFYPVGLCLAFAGAWRKGPVAGGGASRASAPSLGTRTSSHRTLGLSCFIVMCGIFGYYNFGVGRSRKAVLQVLFTGLRRLEYRG